MRRIFDYTFGLVALVFLLIPLLMVALWVRLTFRGLVLWSYGVGRDKCSFKMRKPAVGAPTRQSVPYNSNTRTESKMRLLTAKLVFCTSVETLKDWPQRLLFGFNLSSGNLLWLLIVY